MGSSIALAVSLGMTAIVFTLLGEYAVRLEPERLPLLKGLAWSWSMALVGATAFYGELRHRPWRGGVQAMLALMLVVLFWSLWPRY
jgi:hypothetical protein